MLSLAIVPASTATDDASAESVKVPCLALDPCKEKNLARKERRQRQCEREAAEKIATAKAAEDN